jgi:hypothetical protein
LQTGGHHEKGKKGAPNTRSCGASFTLWLRGPCAKDDALATIVHRFAALAPPLRRLVTLRHQSGD